MSPIVRDTPINSDFNGSKYLIKRKPVGWWLFPLLYISFLISISIPIIGHQIGVYIVEEGKPYPLDSCFEVTIPFRYTMVYFLGIAIFSILIMILFFILSGFYHSSYLRMIAFFIIIYMIFLLVYVNYYDNYSFRNTIDCDLSDCHHMCFVSYNFSMIFYFFTLFTPLFHTIVI